MHSARVPTLKRAKYPGLLIYGILLLASYAMQSGQHDKHETQIRSEKSPHAQLRVLDEPDRHISVFYERWESDLQNKAPVLLLHGSPGNGQNFVTLGPVLAQQGRLVLAPDLPGSGRSDWAPDMSYVSQSQYMMQFLDSQSIDRAHVVGWSSGGGVAIQMAHQHPDRIDSITLLASIGAQETEGSGSYTFEHFKYAVGLIGLGVGPELIPHFGLLGNFRTRSGWLKAFWDADQRKLTEIMPDIVTPTMILHGRHDPLVTDRAAELHHAMMPTSKLVMLDASHFLPMSQAQVTGQYLSNFMDRHDTPGMAPLTEYIDLAPVPNRVGMHGMLYQLGAFLATVPLFVQLAIAAVLVRLWPLVGSLIAMIFVTSLHLDFGVVALGLVIGRIWWLTRGANQLNRPWTKIRWIRSILFVIPIFVVGMMTGALTLSLTEQLGIVGLITGVLAGWIILNTIRLCVTWEGRHRILGWFRRAIYHEYWPRVLIYFPVLWWGIKRMFRRGLQPLTAVNPGYAYDGGVQDESKTDLNFKLGDSDSPLDGVLHAVLINELSSEARSVAATHAIKHDPELGGFPIIAKPDKGERGRAVKLIKDAQSLNEYCENCNEPFILQRFHPGPHELGVVWMRNSESINDPEYSGPSGFIYAITIKHFPVLRGDGKNTLRRLILAHKRHRAQPAVFFEYNKDRLDWIPNNGEKVVLGIAGNHAQGAKFTDGAYLNTPELTQRMNQIIDGFGERAERGFDIGRFDIRCESLEELAQGKGFGIVELNGLTSEPTNLYDPKRSLFWAWEVLLGYWKHLERLAEARIATKTGEPVDDRTWDRIRNALFRAMF